MKNNYFLVPLIYFILMNIRDLLVIGALVPARILATLAFLALAIIQAVITISLRYKKAIQLISKFPQLRKQIKWRL